MPCIVRYRVDKGELSCENYQMEIDEDTSMKMQKKKNHLPFFYEKKTLPENAR